MTLDGDPTGTAWETEHYDSETFEGTKTGPDPGVGIYVTTSEPANPRKMIVRTPTPGWNAQVFAAPAGPPRTSPAGTNRSAKSRTPAAPRKSPYRSSEPSTYFLLWFTKSSPARDQEGRYQIEISDIELLG